MTRRGDGQERGENPSGDWWSELWKLRWSKYPDLPKRAKILDFFCVNYCNDDGGHEVVTYDPPKDGDVNDQTLPFEDDTFDSIVFHASINKDSRIKKDMFPGMPLTKAGSMVGGAGATMWAVNDLVKERWSEYYRISKDGAVWFISCWKHAVHNERIEEKILTDEDRHYKTVIVEGW